jgi:HNH endonuclease
VEIALSGIVASQQLRCYNGIMNTQTPARLTDEELISNLKAAASHERAATARLIALLAEMDTRRLYLAEGYSSLFVYCTQCLRLSEHAAYGRIEAARAARKFPIVLELLTDGSITLTTTCLLASHLTVENCQQVLTAARHKSKREVEQQIATLAPKLPVPSVVRKLPVAAATCASLTMGSATEAPTPPTDAPTTSTDVVQVPIGSQTRPTAVIAALTPERYKVQITINRDTHDKLRRAQDLLRHVVPNGDPAIIFDRALTLLLQDLERRKLAKVDRPRPSTPSKVKGGRDVPAAVRRDVWARDDGRCAFVGTDGRCEERGFLEFHHMIPFGAGGATTVDNLQLRCRAHNGYEARQSFGSFLLRERSVSYNSVQTESISGTTTVPPWQPVAKVSPLTAGETAGQPTRPVRLGGAMCSNQKRGTHRGTVAR